MDGGVVAAGVGGFSLCSRRWRFPRPSRRSPPPICLPAPPPPSSAPRIPLSSHSHLAPSLSSSKNTPSSASTPSISAAPSIPIVKPDFFNGLIIVHGLQGYVSHLSPLSYTVESMTTLSFPQQPQSAAAFSMMRMMLKDAMTYTSFIFLPSTANLQFITYLLSTYVLVFVYV